MVAHVKSGSLTINNCGFIGAVKTTSTNNCGGLVGYLDTTTTVNNSYFAGTFDNTSGCNTFARNQKHLKLNNCYYLNALSETPDGAVRKTAELFASGEVTYLLNGNSPDGEWKQTLKTDAYPNFSGGTVYQNSPCLYYQNTKPDGVKEHNYNKNGICTPTEGIMHYQPAVWNEKDGVYEISNAGQLCWFSCLVNGTLEDTKQNQSANAVLKNDIDMQGVTGYVPIGGTTGLYYSSEGSDKGYKGIFDGNCYVIKNLTVTGSNEKELTYGVFGTLSGTVKNLGVENFNFTLGSKDCRAGGIAGQIISGGYVKDCYVANSAITATGKVAGALAGCNYGGIIENCFTYEVSVTATRTGGIVGDNRGDGGDTDRKGYIFNCYTDVSAIENDGRKGNVFNSDASISETDFASGKFAYNLNGKTSGGVWKQTVNTDKYPNFTGETVYATLENCSPNSASAYGNTKTDIPEHSYKDGICTLVEGEEHYQAATWNEKENVYEIANKGQLLWFTERANNGLAAARGKLTEDIDISSKYDFAIGTSSLPFCGTFDGNGHSLKIKIDSTEQSAAPFPYVNGATIKNLTLFGSVATTQKFASSIIGTVSGGDVKIEKCLSFVEIDTAVSGDGSHGGLVGNMSAGSLTINNCGFAGAIIGESTSSCGGLVGWTNNDINITNSYVAATFEINSDGSNTFSRNQSKAKLSNCYYLTALNETPNGATKKSAQQFASGEVAYLLQSPNGDTLAWGQIANSDGLLPIVTDNEEYKVLPVKSGTSTVGYSLRQKGETNFDGQVDITDYQNAVNIMFGDNNTKTFAEKYDINGDGAVDAGDLFAAQKSGMSDSDYKKLLEKVEESEGMCYMKNADFDLDGIVDILDCVFLERLLGGHTFAHPGHGYTSEGIAGHTYDDNGNCVCGATDCVYDSEINTYTVYSARALYVWCDAATKDFSANLTLGADITLPAKDLTTGEEITVTEGVPSGSNWNPPLIYFGTIEGNNKTISGLIIDKSSSRQSFLGNLQSQGTVKNLNFDNARIYSPYGNCAVLVSLAHAKSKIINCNVKNSSVISDVAYIGSIVGDLCGGYIADCTVSNTTVKGNIYTGGIIGTTNIDYDDTENSKPMIINCHTLGGSISATQRVGGIVGFTFTETAVTACTNSAAVSATDESAGGIVSGSNAVLTACANYSSEISAPKSTASLSAYTYKNIYGSFGFSTEEINEKGNSVFADSRDGVGDIWGNGILFAVKLYDSDNALTEKDVTEMNAAIDDYNKNKQISGTEYCHWKWQYNTTKAPTLYKATTE